MQHLTPPGLAVGAEAETVERQADQGVVAQATFGLHHAQVRMVVLHRQRRHAQPLRPAERGARARKVGVQVVGHGGDGAVRTVDQRRQRRLQRHAGVGRSQVAVQRRPPRRAAIEQQRAVFQEGAAGQHPRRCGLRQGLRLQHGHAGASAPASSQSSQASSPMPVLADSSSTSMPGLTRWA
jgi:hypothetical protein